MSGPQDPAAEGRDRLRAGHADREQVIQALKDAFVQGMLAKDEFDLRVGQTLASLTYADLAALTADLPSGPPATARPPAPLRRRALARAAAGAGACLAIAAVALRGAFILDPGPYPPSNGADGAGMVLFVAICAALAAPCFLIYGVSVSVQQRSSRRQLPPGPGLGGHVLDGERHGGTGHGPIPPGPRTDQTRADLRVHKSRQRQRHIPNRAGRASRGVRPAPGTASLFHPAISRA
jgi:hypothetical protein